SPSAGRGGGGGARRGGGAGGGRPPENPPDPGRGGGGGGPGPGGGAGGVFSQRAEPQGPPPCGGVKGGACFPDKAQRFSAAPPIRGPCSDPACAMGRPGSAAQPCMLRCACWFSLYVLGEQIERWCKNRNLTKLTLGIIESSYFANG